MTPVTDRPPAAQRPRKGNALQAEFEALLSRLEDESVLQSWASFAEAMDVPRELAPALATGRMELLKLVRPRPLTEEECGTVYHLIGVLVRTNQHLKDHAMGLAKMAELLEMQQKGVGRMLRMMHNYAEFRRASEGDEDVDG